jgi:hypothetical protein
VTAIVFEALRPNHERARDGRDGLEDHTILTSGIGMMNLPPRSR